MSVYLRVVRKAKRRGLSIRAMATDCWEYAVTPPISMMRLRVPPYIDPEKEPGHSRVLLFQ